jgi:hypothetical protein
MDYINAEGLPELVARAVEVMVQALREQLAEGQKKEPGELPVWPGTVIGSLTREEIYDDIARLGCLGYQRARLCPLCRC